MKREKWIAFIKKEVVLVVSAILALLSMCLVPPSIAYIQYIDVRVLAILFCLMTVMAGLQKNGVFGWVASVLLQKTKNVRQLCLVLVFLCFFFSMCITNDVALLTFVPFSVLVLQMCQQEQFLIPVIVLQTIAANLGSMLTPIGNPQNIYLYTLGGFSLHAFMGCVFPYWILAGVGIFIWCCFITRKQEKIDLGQALEERPSSEKNNKKKIVPYMVMFLLSMLVVLRVLPYYWVLVLVFGSTLLMEPAVLKRVDYSLLLTFTFFFVFTGNMGHLEVIKQWLQSMVEGRSIWLGILVSQVISNVPAALLLSGFTENYHQLLLGVDLGGLGTLIASMASLISYKIYVQTHAEQKGRYFLYFTVANLVFLLMMVIAYALVG